MTSSRIITELSNPVLFEKLFKRYYAHLCAFAYQYTQNHDMAEEIVQNTFTYLWENASRLEIQTTVESYLHGMVRNASLNHLKHLKVQEKYESHVKQLNAFELANFAELDELEEAIHNALNSLPEKCREIFEMSRYQEMKYKEISDQLGISIKTVETQMSRALKALRLALKHHL